jgi:putative PIN family toxin of toxin-antitoxin system
MLKLRVVIDTNVLVRGIFQLYSYFEYKYGSTRYNETSPWDDEWVYARVNGCIGSYLLPVTSPAIFAEYVDVVNRQNIVDEGINKDVAQLLSFIQNSESVTPRETLSVCRDPDDNRILECAVTGKVDYIITADDDLLCLKEYQGIPILSAIDIVRILRKDRFGQED